MNGTHTNRKTLISIFIKSIRLKPVCIITLGLLCAGILQTAFSTISSQVNTVQIFIDILSYFVAAIPLLMSLVLSLAIEKSGHDTINRPSLEKYWQALSPYINTIVKVLAVFLGSVIMLFAVMALLNSLVKIPYIGELIWPLLCLPNFVAGAILLSILPVIILLVHTLPDFILKTTPTTATLKNLFIVIRTISIRHPIRLLQSTAIGIIVLVLHHAVLFLHLSFSSRMIGKKFIQLLIAMPRFPGYPLKFFIGSLLPCDYASSIPFTHTVGAFMWGTVMLLIVCIPYAFVLNFWVKVGTSLISQPNRNSATSAP